MSTTSDRAESTATTVSHAPDPMQQNAAPCSAEETTFVADAAKPLENPDLSDRQLQAIELLLQGHSDARVAQTLGVNRATVYRWRTSHAPFRWELDRLRKYLIQHSCDRLRSLLVPALDVLAQQLLDPDKRTALRAATLLLKIMAPARRDLLPPIASARENQLALDEIVEAARCANIPQEAESEQEEEVEEESEEEEEQWENNQE